MMMMTLVPNDVIVVVAKKKLDFFSSRKILRIIRLIDVEVDEKYF